MQTFCKIFANFFIDWRWHGSVSVYLVQLVKYQSLLQPWAFNISFSSSCQKANLHERFHTILKALVTFHNHTSDIHVPGINPLSANPLKWSNALKQFVGNLPTNFLSVFDHLMKLAFKGLTSLSSCYKLFQ